MSLSGNTAPNNSPAGGPPPLWRRLAKPFLRWPVTVGMCILAIFIAKNPIQFLLILVPALLLDIMIRFRHKTHDIREEVRALSDRGMMRRYWLCTMACRYYITAVLGLVAWFGAENWLVVALLLTAGLAIDAIRARRSPDLYLEIQQFAADIDLASDGQPRIPVSRRSLWEISILWTIFIVYMIVVLTSARPSRPENLQGYMALFTPLHDLTALFLDSSRRVVGQLTNAGLPDRALVAAHVFAICWLFMMVNVIWFTPATYSLLIGGAQKTKNMSETAKNNWSFWTAVMIVVLAVGFYWFVFDLLSVNFTPKRGKSSFHVHESNGPYHMPVMTTLLITFFFIGTYLGLVRLRLQLWRGWQERHSSNAVTDPSPTSTPLT